MGVWDGREEASKQQGSGAHYLHGNLYHWEKKRKEAFSVRQAEFYNTEEELQYTQTPTKSPRTSHRTKEYLLIMYPLTLASTLQLHPL